MYLKKHRRASRNNYFAYSAIIISMVISIQIACRKELPVEIPSLVTINITGITTTSITSGGLIYSPGGASILSRGICLSIEIDPEISDIKSDEGSGTGSFASTVSGLNGGTTYYIRAYATNSYGTGYGNQYVIKTMPVPPSLTTTEVTSITAVSSFSGGSITSDGGSDVTARGVCWSTTPGPEIQDNLTSDGTGAGIFTSTLSGLTAETTYYVRAYATNRAGTSYGNELSFTTGSPIANCGTVTDFDGNTYNTVTIGSQCWFRENLKTTHLNDGTEIPNVVDNWNGQTPQYCWVNNDDGLKDLFGGLYNWHTVNTGKLCPDGWHVPSDDEWYQLVLFLDPGATQGVKYYESYIAGGKLKETGFDHWTSPNTGATNQTGFTALAGGYRAYTGVFEGFGHDEEWWSSTLYSSTHALQREVGYNNNNVARIECYLEFGFSVRCIKDN